MTVSSPNSSHEPKFKTVGELLMSQKKQIEAALPKHMSVDRMLRIVMTEIRHTPKLKLCTPASLIGAVIQTSQLALEPGNGLGHAYLVPYKNHELSQANKMEVFECQFVIGYRGMIDLAHRSGKVISIDAQEIYEHDFFECEYGLNPKLRHVPARKEAGAFLGVYSVVHLVNGGQQMKVMWKDSVDHVRKKSKAAQSGPWVTNYEEMAKKSVIRRLFKYLPASVEMQKAIILDEAADRGEQHNGFILEGEIEDHMMGFSQPSERKSDALLHQLNA